MTYFIYIDYTTEETPRPFYIGKGNEKRIKDVKRNDLHTFIANQFGQNRVIVFKTENEIEAFNKERELIALFKLNIKRYPNSFGANKTDGGEGRSGGEGCSGYKHTEEAKNKISEAKIGNKGRLGKPHTDETKKKLSEAGIGRKHSEETKQKMAEAKIGNKNFLGKTHTEEAKKKMSKAKLGAMTGKTWKIIDGKRVWSK